MTTARPQSIESAGTGKQTALGLVAVFLTYFTYSLLFPDSVVGVSQNSRRPGWNAFVFLGRFDPQPGSRFCNAHGRQIVRLVRTACIAHCIAGHMPGGHILVCFQLKLCDAHNRPHVSIDRAGRAGASLFLCARRHVRVGRTQQVGWASQYSCRDLRHHRPNSGRMVCG